MQFYVLLLPRSNPGFVELGRRIGKETLFKYIEKFGFGEKTGVDLNGEGSGILFSLDRVGPVELATTAFGQWKKPRQLLLFSPDFDINLL